MGQSAVSPNLITCVSDCFKAKLWNMYGTKQYGEVFRFRSPDRSTSRAMLAVDPDNLFVEDPLVDPASVYTDISEFTFQWK